MSELINHHRNANKVTGRYHCSTTERVKLPKQILTNKQRTKAGKQCQLLVRLRSHNECSHTVRGYVNYYSDFENQSILCLNLEITVPHEPKISLLCITPTKMDSNVHEGACPRIFKMELFVIANPGEQCKCISTEEWIHCYMFIERYVAITLNEL